MEFEKQKEIIKDALEISNTFIEWIENIIKIAYIKGKEESSNSSRDS